MIKNPHQDTRLAKFVELRVSKLKPRKSQKQIAREVGFPNANMVSMIKNGTSKLALERVPSMARALECDPALLMRLSLEQAVGGDAAIAIASVFGAPVSTNELNWLQEIRRASEHSDPKMTKWSRAVIGALFDD